jgi:SP family myo-inositol transporter-like MFS transporter 13
VSDQSGKSSFEEDDLKDPIEHCESMNVQDLDTIESTRCGKYAWLVSITAGVGGFLFGYDTGIISSILVVLTDDLGEALK